MYNLKGNHLLTKTTDMEKNLNKTECRPHRADALNRTHASEWLNALASLPHEAGGLCGRYRQTGSGLFLFSF